MICDYFIKMISTQTKNEVVQNGYFQHTTPAAIRKIWKNNMYSTALNTLKCLFVLAILETHLSENVAETIAPSNSHTNFTLFHSKVNLNSSQSSNKKKAGEGFVV